MTNNSLPLSKKKDRTSYQTFDFINDLLRELQNHPELLAKMFPTRVEKYTNLDLSMIWGHQKDYINSYLHKIRSGKLPNFRFKSKGLTVLKNEVINKLGVKAIGILSIIDLYESSDITTLEFIGKSKRELGRVSGDIEVTLKELSQIFGKSPNFITTLKRSLEDCDINWFKADYNFSKEILNELRDNLKIDTYSFREALHFSVEYERLNPKIPDYSHQ